MAIKEVGSLETAMPMLIPQDQLNMKYVETWRKRAEYALRRNSVTKVKLTTHPIPLYLYKRSTNSGVWFASTDGQSVDYLYAYQQLKVSNHPRAAEALAYLFNPDVRGLTREVFFDFLLPDRKFVVTDSMYTEDGKRWFEAQYMLALSHPEAYTVYAVDLKSNSLKSIFSKEEFHQLQPKFWGRSVTHQKLRFAIEVKPKENHHE